MCLVFTMEKFAVITCIAAIMALTNEVSGRNVRILFQECQSDPKTHVDEALLRKGLKGELTDETPLGPHALCMNIKRGFQSQSGDVNVEALRKYLDEAEDSNGSLVDQVITECGHRNGTTAQQAALALLDCIHRIIPHKENHQTGSGGKDRLHQIHDECQEDPASPVNEEGLLKFLKGEKVDGSALGPHILCMNVKGGLQSQNGDIVQGGLETFLIHKTTDSSAVERIIKECGQRNGSTPEEAAVALIKCFIEHAQGAIDFSSVFGNRKPEV